MKLVDYYLLKEGDKVVVNGKVKTVKAPPKNMTVKCNNKYYYFNEIDRKV